MRNEVQVKAKRKEPEVVALLGEKQAGIYSWCYATSPSDINFQNALKNSEAKTVELLLADVPQADNKTRISLFEKRLRKLSRNRTATEKPISDVSSSAAIKFTLAADDADNAGNLGEVEISRIHVSQLKTQERRRAFFKQSDLDELGDSILRLGLQHPILLRPRRAPMREHADTDFEIVFGERRFLAAKSKGLTKIKCFVENLSDAEAVERQYAENHGRENPDPLSDAFTYQYLIERENYTEQTIADHFNIAPKLVTERLRLNGLIDEAKTHLTNGKLPLRHAYYLAKFSIESQREIVDKRLAFKWHDMDNGATSYSDFKQEVESVIVRRLADAPFDTESPELHIRKLKCTDCTERSGYSPALFTDDFGADDVCLNKKCFEAKTSVHFTIEREKIAETMPNPRSLPIREIAKQVPIVADRPTTVAAFNNKPRIVQTTEMLPEPECEFAVLSLAVAGLNKGKQVYVCTAISCPVHNPPPEPEEQTDEAMSLMRANQIRTEVFRRAVDWFDHNRVLWMFDDYVKNLITQIIWATRFSHGDDILFLIRDWTDAPRNFANLEKVRAFAETLDKRDQSRLLYLFANLNELSVSSERTLDTAEIRKIAQDCGLDYDKIAEEVW